MAIIQTNNAMISQRVRKFFDKILFYCPLKLRHINCQQNNNLRNKQIPADVLQNSMCPSGAQIHIIDLQHKNAILAASPESQVFPNQSIQLPTKICHILLVPDLFQIIDILIKDFFGHHLPDDPKAFLKIFLQLVNILPISGPRLMPFLLLREVDKVTVHSNQHHAKNRVILSHRRRINTGKNMEGMLFHPSKALLFCPLRTILFRFFQHGIPKRTFFLVSFFGKVLQCFSKCHHGARFPMPTLCAESNNIIGIPQQRAGINL